MWHRRQAGAHVMWEIRSSRLCVDYVADSGTSSVDSISDSRRAQGADHGLWITLDHCQVGTDGDLRAPAALFPVL